MNSRYFLAWLLLASVLFGGCRKTGDLDPNGAPDTRLVFESINLSGDDRLNSQVRLSWYGVDGDGYIAGFEVSLDNITWTFTTTQDSTFRFPIEAGSDSADIDFYVRAIDNQGLRDLTPAYLQIPIKNTPPQANFITESIVSDSALTVFTFGWESSDTDGDETIRQAFLKVNDGEWLSIPVSSSLLSIVPTDPMLSGTQDALVYIGQDSDPLPQRLTGLRNGDTNRFFIKVSDIAESESVPDTTNAIRFIPQTSDLLLISGEGQPVYQRYFSILDIVYPSYDWVDYSLSTSTPLYWDPTFKLLIQQYDKIIFHTDQAEFTNQLTNQVGLLLGFASPVLLEYFNNGGKMIITAAFSNNQDISAIVGIMPMDSVRSSVTLSPDSSIIPLIDSNFVFPGEFPEPSASAALFSLDPFFPSADAIPLYKAGINDHPNEEDQVIAAMRPYLNGRISQVFFTIPLYGLDQDQAELNALFQHILTDEFDW